MKKTLVTVALLAGAVSGYSQGAVSMTDYGSSYLYHVYGVQPAAPTGNVTTDVVTYGGYTTTEYQGNVSSDKPTSAQNTGVYSTGTALSGTAFDAQLLGLTGTGDSLSSLLPLGSVFNFTTAGLLNASGKAVTIPNSQPGSAAQGGTGATIALAAWAANGVDGAATSLSAAQADGYAWGISDVVSIAALGGSSSPPTTNPTIGITSFSLGSVPEPSTIALGVMGASALLFRRRK